MPRRIPKKQGEKQLKPRYLIPLMNSFSELNSTRSKPRRSTIFDSRRESVYEAPRIALFPEKPKVELSPSTKQERAFLGWMNHCLAPNFETAQQVRRLKARLILLDCGNKQSAAFGTHDSEIQPRVFTISKIEERTTDQSNSYPYL